MHRRVRITAAEARRIALAAQGFDRPRPGASPDARHFGRVIERLGLLQLDFVNVLVPAQYLVVYSRLGPYDRERFERFLYRSGRHTEQWAHEASVVPVDAWPLLAHRRDAWRHWRQSPLKHLGDAEPYLRQVLEQVASDGALTADDLPAVDGPKRKAGDWHRSMRRWALEHHFGGGRLTVRDRKPNFQRVYDLPERVIPGPHLDRQLSPDDARTELLERAARACGIATLQDLSDYWRMSPRDAAPLVDRLVAAGRLSEIAVDGWSQVAYLAPTARCPRRIDGASLLSPFDPVAWFRPRTERMFDFHYRIEIYTPEPDRVFGYYSLPLLVDDALVGRVDLKADRKAGVLRVQSAWAEADAPEETAARLVPLLRDAAAWQGLDDIAVAGRGTLSPAVASELARA